MPENRDIQTSATPSVATVTLLSGGQQVPRTYQIASVTVTREINRIPGSVLIPKGEFLSGAALEQLPSDKQIVIHCKTGVRSAEALAIVKAAGYKDAVHVGGGVAAWVNQIDPSQPAY